MLKMVYTTPLYLCNRQCMLSPHNFFLKVSAPGRTLCGLTILEPFLVHVRVRGGFPDHLQLSETSESTSTVIGLGSTTKIGPTTREKMLLTTTIQKMILKKHEVKITIYLWTTKTDKKNLT